MLRGYRSIILAFAGLILTAAQQPTKQPQTTERQSQESNSTNDGAAPSEAAQPPYRPYADRYSDTCYNAQNHDTADLCAQWRAAIAAEKAAKEARIATIAAIVGTVLSLATVIGLIVTIWQTNGALGEARRGNRLNLAFERRSRKEARKATEDQERALEIAERNAEAAAGLVRVSEDTAKRQLRAYVKFTMPQDNLSLEIGQKIVIKVKMINCGLTPAKNGSFKHAVGIAGQDWRWQNELPERSAENAVTIHQNEPYRSEMVSTFEFNQDHGKAIFENGQVIFARATFHYDDVFGDAHVTQLSIEIGKHELETGQVKVARYGNIST